MGRKQLSGSTTWLVRAPSAASPLKGETVFLCGLPTAGAKDHVCGHGYTNANRPVGSRDGKQIFCSPGPGDRLAVVRIATAPGVTFSDADMIPRPFLGIAPDFPRNYDVTSDGRFIAV